MRERTSWAAAAGSAVVASNADNGTSIRMASDVGLVWPEIMIPTRTAPSTETPTAAVDTAPADAAGAAARSCARPRSRCSVTDSAMT